LLSRRQTEQDLLAKPDAVTMHHGSRPDIGSPLKFAYPWSTGLPRGRSHGTGHPLLLLSCQTVVLDLML